MELGSILRAARELGRWNALRVKMVVGTPRGRVAAFIALNGMSGSKDGSWSVIEVRDNPTSSAWKALGVKMVVGRPLGMVVP